MHIGDIIAAFGVVLEAPRSAIHDEAFNVGRSGENYRIRDVADLVAEIVPDCTVEYASDASGDQRDYRVDFSKIEQQLPGYAPTWTVPAGIAELLRADVGAGLTAENWDGDRYYRLRTVRSLIESGELDRQLRWTS